MVSGANFALAILLARNLGLEEFGRYSIALSTMWFVMGLHWGLTISPLMSIGPKQSDEARPGWLGASFIQHCLFAVVVFVVLLAGTLATHRLAPQWGMTDYALPLACAAVATLFQEFVRNHFFSRGRTPLAFLVDAVCHIGRLGSLWVAFGMSDPDSVDVLWILAASAIASALVGAPFVDKMAWRADVIRATLIRHWNFGKWISASTILAWIAEHLFVVAAGSILGASAAGALRVAEQPLRALAVLYQGLNNIVPVYAARLFATGGMAALRRFTQTVAALGFVPAAIVALSMAIFADDLLALVFKEAYRAHGWIVRWYAVIYLVAWFETPLMAALRALESTRTIFLAYLGPAIIVGAGLYPMIGLYGLAGGLGLLVPAALVRQILLVRALRPLMRQSCSAPSQSASAP